MKKYSWIKKVGKSLVPSDFYIHILQEPMHKAFLYMLLFITLLSLITGSYIGYQQMVETNQVIEEYKTGVIPPFKVSKDGLWVEGDTPVYIDHLKIPVILDDEGIVDINDIMSYDQAIFFEKERIVFISGVGTALYDYDDLNILLRLFMLSEFDSEAHMQLFETMAIVSIPASIFAQFITSIISFFYYSLMVLMIANITRTILGLGLRVKQVYHMVIYALTFSTFWSHFSILLPTAPPMLLDTFVHFVLPALILGNVFMHIKRKAIDEINKNKK